VCEKLESARDELPPIFSPTKRVGLAPVVTEESNDSASKGPNGEESTVLTRTRQQAAKHQNALAKSATASVDRLLDSSVEGSAQCSSFAAFKSQTLNKSSKNEIDNRFKNKQTESVLKKCELFCYFDLKFFAPK
jgi:hypothetical protein